MKTKLLNRPGSRRANGLAVQSQILSPVLWLATDLLLATLTTSVAQPVILTEPQSRTNVVGTEATFSVEATNSAPLACQWQKFVSPNWPDLADRTNATLVLTNVQTSDAGDYCVVVTNLGGAVTSAVATLTVWVPPAIVLQPKDQAVAAGNPASFRVTATGSSPFSYQWLRDGAELTDATNAFLRFTQAELNDVGAYAVRVTNLAGAVTSRVAQLSVAEGWTFTDSTGLQIPYRLFLPHPYDPDTNYPLVFFFPGYGGNEVPGDNLNQLDDQGQFVFLNSTNRARHPCFFLSPAMPYYIEPTPDNHHQIVDAQANLLESLESQYRIDPERIYVTGNSAGGGISWAMLARHHERLAAVVPMSAGWKAGSYTFATIQDFGRSLGVPVWYFRAADDTVGTASTPEVDAALTALRGLGAKVIYTRYQIGGHGIWPVAYSTPGLVDWVMAQRRNVAPTNEPLLSITGPSETAVLLTGATHLNLTGSAAVLEEAVNSVAWTNLANNLTGIATGSNSWTATSIPLAANQTNIILVTAITTSWSANYRGNTTFNDTLTVIQSPLQAALTLQGAEALLNWTGGVPPYQLQSRTNLTAGDWQDEGAPTDQTSATILLEGTTKFFRVLSLFGQTP